MVKNLPVNAGDIRDTDSIPGLGRSPVGGNSNPLQYSCLENPMDRGAWQAAVHRVAELDMTEATCMHAYNPLFKIGKYILLVDVLEHSQEMKEQSIHIYIGW